MPVASQPSPRRNCRNAASSFSASRNGRSARTICSARSASVPRESPMSISERVGARVLLVEKAVPRRIDGVDEDVAADGAEVLELEALRRAHDALARRAVDAARVAVAAFVDADDRR